MGNWPGKYIIGLTGNIATGKSVVRKMLEHLGAYGIDADELAHFAITKDAPGYQPVVDTFGRWLLDADGQIYRARLGRMVFSDPEALGRLESIVHPLVRQGVDVLIRRISQKVVVVEAIKLLESSLGKASDAIWVTYAPEEVQLTRLIEKRGFSEAVARQRISAQPPQEEKVAAAQVVIYNQGPFEDTWGQVYSAWGKTLPGNAIASREPVSAGMGTTVERALPGQAAEIAGFITRIRKDGQAVDPNGILATFGEKAFLLLREKGQLVGMVGWQVENLIVRIVDVFLEPAAPAEATLRSLLGDVERAAQDLHCEVSLLFLPPKLARRETTWRPLGYQARSVEELGVHAWQEAARESMPAGTILLYKQLRADRIPRPI